MKEGAWRHDKNRFTSIHFFVHALLFITIIFLPLSLFHPVEKVITNISEERLIKMIYPR